MARILVIEDNTDLNRVYTLILERAGHEVESVHDGSQGLARLQHSSPDLILLDLIMPRLSGVQFLKDARLAHKHPDTKVLLFTNLDHGPEITEAFKQGAARCAIKARTTPRGLVKAVQNLLREKLS